MSGILRKHEPIKKSWQCLKMGKNLFQGEREHINFYFLRRQTDRNALVHKLGAFNLVAAGEAKLFSIYCYYQSEGTVCAPYRNCN